MTAGRKEEGVQRGDQAEALKVQRESRYDFDDHSFLVEIGRIEGEDREKKRRGGREGWGGRGGK